MCLERVKGTRVATSAAESYSWMQQGIRTSCCVRCSAFRVTTNTQVGERKRERERERRGKRKKKKQRFCLEKGT
ncbi:hypothetical protein WN48_08922 [Eufriesea mexicana]|uniref:Uncharacterized protein n=1 Tax=Eufriesea mexicana TaxID=516756 RepID=A0A310SQH3_9HYME|nr:hypothetical protein WN48_08922 [Eufriesea mexicana]